MTEDVLHSQTDDHDLWADQDDPSKYFFGDDEKGDAFAVVAVIIEGYDLRVPEVLRHYAEEAVGYLIGACSFA